MEAVQYPVPATWAPSSKMSGNKLVLEDHYGNRLIKKAEYGTKAYYWCGRKDQKCPVKVTLDKESDQIVSARNEHNHDSDRVVQFIKDKRREVVDNAVVNPTVVPRAAYKDLVNIISSSPSTSSSLGLLPKARNVAKQIQRKI